MSLATRCPSCGTVFRVVQDQLRVSEGWVRCGRCSSVFNAAEVLFDIDTGTPMRLASAEGSSPVPGGPPRPDHAEFGRDDGQDIGATAHHEVPGPAEPAFAPPSPPDRTEPRLDDRPLRATPGADLREEPLLRAPSSAPDDEIVITDHPGASPAVAAVAASVAAARHPAAPMVPTATPAPPPPPAAAPAVAEESAPSFLRAAERAERWRSPAMRAALAAAVVVLALAALLQVALVWRDSLAAHLPASAPALQALCRLTGCSVQPLRRLDALAVDSSGLNRLEGSTLYRLQVVLHNRADTAVMMPALELSLTDAQGRLVARRVLPVAELGAPQPVLQAGQELPLKALVSTGERRVDGYTLELFYP